MNRLALNSQVLRTDLSCQIRSWVAGEAARSSDSDNSTVE